MTPCTAACLQEACLQGNLIAICLEQLSDPHPLLRQWVAICLGRIWQNFDSARWCGVRDSAHEKLCSLLSDPIPEVRLQDGSVLEATCWGQEHGLASGPSSSRPWWGWGRSSCLVPPWLGLLCAWGWAERRASRLRVTAALPAGALRSSLRPWHLCGQLSREDGPLHHHRPQRGHDAGPAHQRRQPCGAEGGCPPSAARDPGPQPRALSPLARTLARADFAQFSPKCVSSPDTHVCFIERCLTGHVSGQLVQ